MMATKICVIDDTIDLLLNLTEFLEMESFEVWPCKNAYEALDLLTGKLPDLIITDLSMPMLDGMSFIAQIRGDPKLVDIPVIIFSASFSQDYEAKARPLNVHHYVKKPATLDEILRIVNLILKK